MDRTIYDILKDIENEECSKLRDYVKMFGTRNIITRRQMSKWVYLLDLSNRILDELNRKELP